MTTTRETTMTELPAHKTDSFLQSNLFQQIGEICAAVNIARTDQELLEISLTKLMAMYNARRGSIYLLSDNGQELTLKIAKGMETDEQQKLVKRLGEGIVGKVAEIKKPLFVQDITKDDRFPEIKARQSYSTPSFLCAPLLYKDKLIGVINIADKSSGMSFTSAELQILDFLTSQIALNYRRTQLYNKFKKVLKESQTLKDELSKSSEVTNKLQQQVHAQERLASIGKLAGGIAHELNNPLDGVLRYINLSLNQIGDDDPVHEYLLEAKHGLNRMANIVRSLLACSRNAPPSMQTVNVNEVLNDGIGALGSALFVKNITLEKKFTPDLPPIINYGIDRIVTNLLRNAIDAVDQGGLIEVGSQFKEGTILIHVSDNGKGIEQDAMEKIFEPFYTTKNMDKGCGLGLTIVYEIVKAYNGDIRVESAPGRGTTFTIIIPVLENDGQK